MTAASEGQASSISDLAGRLGREWPTILTCAQRAADRRVQLTQAAEDLVPTDCALVVFGSLARGEATTQSDLDWTLLVDGQADPQHLRAAREIQNCFRTCGIKDPGRTGLFGGLTFSHDLIHAIGGEEDTNSNTTRRILLLLESSVLQENAPVCERVKRHLYSRYLGEDRGYHVARGWKVKVPRFLLNDIVRFWADDGGRLRREASRSRRPGLGPA